MTALEQAHALLLTGDVDDALALLASADDDAARRLRAQVLARSGRPVNALADLDRLAQPTHEDYLLRARLLNALERPREAAAVLESLHAAAPQDKRLCELLYDQLMAMGEAQAAVEVARPLSEDWRWRMRLAEAEAEAGQPAAALAHYEQALHALRTRHPASIPPYLHSAYVSALIGAASAAIDCEQFAQARAYLATAAAHSDDPAIACYDALARRGLGDPDAEAALQAALAQCSPTLRAVLGGEERLQH
jgi:tetratricopeptide (TPR) repeat protein